MIGHNYRLRTAGRKVEGVLGILSNKQITCRSLLNSSPDFAVDNVQVFCILHNCG
jgi:hypothetical protein